MYLVHFFIAINIIFVFVHCDDITEDTNDENQITNEAEVPVGNTGDGGTRWIVKSNEQIIIINDTEMTELEKVDVKIYYETLCPYCINFFVYYLQPEIASLHKYLNIRLFPYGNAVTKEEGDHFEITCQHGESECYGNKLHACAIDILKNVTKSTQYNCCLMGNQSDDHAADECGAQMKIDPEPIKECAKGDKGKELLKKYGEKSTNVGFPGVPFILVDGKTSSADYFKKDICEAFIEPPPSCNKT